MAPNLQFFELVDRLARQDFWVGPFIAQPQFGYILSCICMVMAGGGGGGTQMIGSVLILCSVGLHFCCGFGWPCKICRGSGVIPSDQFIRHRPATLGWQLSGVCLYLFSSFVSQLFVTFIGSSV